ncbi:DUF937 domain-containing protein [Arcobacter sp. LA11]|uniref:DUF937 domain-containing protein n=1 Tax=Arcobacter sp. LA11 TaxID=1898176 RepID=UPI0009322758|nr:DUF937 domain-containing protein [Arcobacter sp. LA11]
MNILNTILENGLDENILGAISNKTGIDTNSVQSLVSQLAPQLLNGAKQNLTSDNDSSDLINMISNTNLDEISQNPDAIDSMDNSNMLGQLFSSLNENESDITNALSAKSGIDTSSIASLLPMVAPLIMGALNKQTNLSSTDTSDTNSITSMLSDFIDQDNDGSVVDDLMGMAKKFF